MLTTRRHGGRLTDGRRTQRGGVIAAGLDTRWRSGHAAFAAALQIHCVKGCISEVCIAQGVFSAARSAILHTLIALLTEQFKLLMVSRSKSGSFWLWTGAVYIPSTPKQSTILDVSDGFLMFRIGFSAQNDTVLIRRSQTLACCGGKQVIMSQCKVFNCVELICSFCVYADARWSVCE